MARVCDACGRKAVIHVEYSGRHLCGEHFNDFYLKRVKRELRSQRRIANRVAVGVSGGKDSMALLDVLYGLLSPAGVDVVALAIDEGISGYRDRSLDVLEGFASERDIELVVLGFEDEFGTTMDSIVSGQFERGACSYCGVFRRSLLNTGALRMEADVIATGHTVDDMAQTGLMNFLRGDVDRIIRTGPHRWVQEGLVPRILPLRRIPEKENMLYCVLNEVPHLHGECPYSGGAHRRFHREVIAAAEEDTPGTRHAVVNSMDRIVTLFSSGHEPEPIGSCTRCGDATGGEVCMKCRYLDEIAGSPGGSK